MKFTQIAVLVAAGAGIALAGTPAAEAQGLTVVPSLQCPLGCGTVVYDVQLSNTMARNGSKVSLAPQETPGYMYNIRYMGEKYDTANNTTFGTEDMVLQLAPLGGKGLIKDSLAVPVDKKFKFLWQMAALGQGRFFVTFDPSIKTIADMKGKNVDLGLLTQSDWGLSARIVLDTYGITKDNTHINYVTPQVMTDQLINGTTDVATTALLGDPTSDRWSGGSLLVKLAAASEASGKKLHYISVDQSKINEINKKYGTTLFTSTLKPGTLAGQTEPLTVGLNRAYHAVTDAFPDDVAYELTKSAIKYGGELAKEGGLWSFWSEGGLVSGLTECNTNPGAIKAFKEAGIWDLRTKGGPEAKIPGC